MRTSTKSNHRKGKDRHKVHLKKKHGLSGLKNQLSLKSVKGNNDHQRKKSVSTKVASKNVKFANRPNSIPVKLKEESSSSDSEPNPLTELVSCFTNSSKKSSVVSDEDSDGMDSSDDECKVATGSILESEDILDGSEYLSPEIEESNCSSEMEDDAEVILSSGSDPFESHIQFDLDESLYSAVSTLPQKTEEHVKSWPILGHIKINFPKPAARLQTIKSVRLDDDVKYASPGDIPSRIENVSIGNLETLFVKSQLHGNILGANRKHISGTLTENKILTPLQSELFSVINNYQDLYFPERTLENGEEVRFVYCLHTINHVLKTRLKVVHHNARLANKQDFKGDVPEEFRDQGLIRPKVLILVPFRNSALRVVEVLASILLEEGNNNILNKKRFYEEFTAGEIAMPRRNPKPEDYEKTFAGDTDDNFKLGISVTKKSLKLYSDFYSADIIVASPLGLRVIVGAEGQRDRDFDFLASIELLILDQAEVILMQNWEHLLHIWDHLHMQPRESHGTNFARVRGWALSGRARYYRQTLVFCTYSLPQISALFSRRCHNYAGKVFVINPIRTGTICHIVLQLPQVFNRIECSSPTSSIDARFEYFISKVLPQYKEPLMSHTVIYVPSYFDYVRIRNYFKKETVSFVQICEYSKDGKVARARDMFFHSSAHFLLYSERFHFFRRIRLKGIRHIVFYQPPTIPHFYSELCNLMQSDKQAGEDSLSVSVLYTRYDTSQLAAIVGSERAAKMLSSDRAVHMFMTGD